MMRTGLVEEVMRHNKTEAVCTHHLEGQLDANLAHFSPTGFLEKSEKVRGRLIGRQSSILMMKELRVVHELLRSMTQPARNVHRNRDAGYGHSAEKGALVHKNRQGLMPVCRRIRGEKAVGHPGHRQASRPHLQSPPSSK
jgi:hypothetical protein